MKIIFITAIILSSVMSNLFSQNGTIKIAKPSNKTNDSIIETKKDTVQNHYLFEGATFSYEQTYFLSNFQNQLKNIENIDFNKPCNLISFGYFGQLHTGRSYNFPAILAFSYLLPSKITINDSVKEKLSGFNFTISVAGQNLIKRKHFGLFITEGIKGGRLKLVEDPQRKMKNSTFGPFAGIVLRTTVSYFTIFTSGQFCYDISSPKWKPTWISKSSSFDISNFSQSCFTFTMGISYSLDKNYYP